MTVSSDILKHIFNLKPEKAAEYLKQKGMKTSGAWWQVYEKEHARVFTVAQTSAIKAGYDVLKDIRAAVQKAIDEGTTLRDFQKELKPLLKQKGWWGKVPDPKNPEKEIQLGSVRRLEKIFDINVRTAYQTGRYNDLAENAKFRPYWQYIAVMDDRTRKEHKSLHGKVFRHDDPFWDTFFPPNGWNCRCTVKSLSERELKQRGLTVENTDGKLLNATATLPNGQKVTGKVYRNGGKIVQTDVGWNYNPGKAAYQPMDDGKDPVLRKQLDGILARGNEGEEEKKLMLEIDYSVREKGLAAVKDFDIEMKKIKRSKSKFYENTVCNTISGYDDTEGSCSSLALAYIGNRHGFKVLDFRGGTSQIFFSLNAVTEKISGLANGTRLDHYNDYAAAKKLLKTVKEGERYFLSVGRHNSIIKKQDGEFYYLELQDSEFASFKLLDKKALKNRFHCQYSHTYQKQRYKVDNYIFNVDNLKGVKEFEDLLGYINTAEDQQLKED